MLLFEKIIKQHHVSNTKDNSKANKEIESEIEKNTILITNAQKLLLDGEMEMKDYKEIKE